MATLAPGQTPAEEPIFGFGTSNAVDALLGKMRTTANMTVMVAINLDTLIRNAVGVKSTMAQTVVNNVRKQMSLISNAIADICHEKWRDRTHHILFYMADSSKIVPKEYLRPRNSPTHAAIDAARKLFAKTVHNGDQTDGNVQAHVRMTDQMRVPSYKGLREVISKWTQSDVDLQLISHMDLDYHVTLGTDRKGFLYRSHTGEIVKLTPSDLGKTVFKNDVVPFYPCTHVLFGDSHLLKAVLTTKFKNQVKEYARRDHWTMHTEQFVKTKLKEYNFVLPYNLD